jgi:hypothetical protein
MVMNIKAIIASLVLGSSSIAMAAPGVTASAAAGGSYGATVVRDHRIDDDRAPAGAVQPTYEQSHRPGWIGGGRTLPPVYRPVTLASGLQLASNGRTFIAVANQARTFATLQITAAGGRTFIKQVTVEFANGQRQVMRNLDRTLAGNDSLTLDLDGGRRNISRIVVYGNATTTGWHRALGTFNVLAS